MAIKEFKIVFDGRLVNGQTIKVFNVGEKLTGQIVISGIVKNISGLKLVLAGRGRSYWRELTGDDTKLDFNDEEKYLYFDVDLDIEDSINSRKEYSFEFNIPHGLPSSFEGLYGDITYTLTAILGMNKQSITRSIQSEFKLQGHLNLNDYREIVEPIEVNVTKYMLFEVGHLGLYAKLNKSGYSAGEKVGMMMKFKNECTSQIQVNLFLLQETIYFAGENKITHTEIIDTKQGPAVEPSKEEIWKGNLVQIPVTNNPILGNCKLIQIQYRFLIEMDIPGPHMNLEATIPIIIGTVPFMTPAAGGERAPLVPTISITEEPKIEPTDLFIEDPAIPTVEEPAVSIEEPLDPFIDEPTEPHVEGTTEPTVPAERPTIPIEEPSVPTERPQGGESNIPDTTSVTPEPEPAKLNRSKFRARNQRAHTTTNVFRPRPVKQILPTPKPETWSKPIILEKVSDDDEGNISDVESNDESIEPGKPTVFTPTTPDPTPVPEPQEQVTEISKKYCPKHDENDVNLKPKTFLPYPTVDDKSLFPKPLRKCLINIFKVAENKILEPIGWRIKKNTCNITKPSKATEPGLILPCPSVKWGNE